MPIIYESYAVSSEVKVTVQKKPTEMRLYLFNEAGTERMEDKTVYVGSKLLLRTALFTEPWYTGLAKKKHYIFHRVNTGAWEQLVTGTAETNFIEYLYTLPIAGIHSFYAEFKGDAEYIGCSKVVKLFAR